MTLGLRRTAAPATHELRRREGLARRDEREASAIRFHHSALMAAGETVLLVGGQPLLLDAAERLLAESGFVVVGKSSSAKRALRLLGESPAQVVLLDLQMGVESIALIRDIRARHVGTAVVALSEAGDEAGVQTALAEGADACVLKSGDPADLVTAVRQARRRSVFFSPPAGNSHPVRVAPSHSELTQRELEILGLVAEGASNMQVARKLWVTEQTVKFHLSNVYRKLGVANRTEASRYAQLHGLLLIPTGRAGRRDRV
jgi:DNA-binding NarL/FixJ family response regulator